MLRIPLVRWGLVALILFALYQGGKAVLPAPPKPGELTVPVLPGMPPDIARQIGADENGRIRIGDVVRKTREMQFQLTLPIVQMQISEKYRDEMPQFSQPRPIRDLKGIESDPAESRRILFQSRGQRFRLLAPISEDDWYLQIDSAREGHLEVKGIDDGWPSPSYTKEEADRNLPRLEEDLVGVDTPHDTGGDDEFLRAAFQPLLAFGPLAAPTLLEIASSNADPLLRAESLWHYASLAGDDPQALAAIERLRNDGAPMVRLAAVGALARRGRQSEDDLRAAVEASSQNDPPLQMIALQALGAFDQHVDGAFAALVRALTESGGLRTIGVERVAKQALLDLGPAALPKLVAFARDDRNPVRSRVLAIGVIGALGAGASAAAPDLAALLESWSGDIALAAARALPAVGAQPVAAIEAVMRWSRDPDATAALLATYTERPEEVARASIRLLSVKRFDRAGLEKGFVPVFRSAAGIESLRSIVISADASANQRANALGVITSMKEPRGDIVSVLEAALASPYPEARIAAARGLAALGEQPPEAARAAASVLAERDVPDEVREDAVRALGDLDRHLDVVLPALMKLVLAPGARNEPPAIALLGHRGSGPRAAASQLLEERYADRLAGSREAIAVIVDALDDPGELVQLSAARWLSRVPSSPEARRRAVLALVPVIERPNGVGQRQALELLAKFGPDARPARAALERLAAAGGDPRTLEQVHMLLAGLRTP